MKTREKALIDHFKHNKGILRFSQVLEAGFDPKYLRTLVRKGEIEKMGHGLYRFSQSEALSNPDLVTVALMSPKGVICLISALFFHRATEEIPRNVDIAIPRGFRANKIDYPPVQYFRFSEKAWKSGVETHRIDGHPVKIYGLAKTIADCFKYRNKIGRDVALSALKTAVTEKKIRPAEMMHYAKICRMDNIMRPYLEALL